MKEEKSRTLILSYLEFRINKKMRFIFQTQSDFLTCDLKSNEKGVEIFNIT